MMLTARASHLPLRELASVRRALHQRALSLAPFPDSQRCSSVVVLASRKSETDQGNVEREFPVDKAEPRRPRAAKGFGAPQQRAPLKAAPARRDKVFDDDGAAPQEDKTGQASSRPEYQVYTDDQFKPKRYIGKVQTSTVEGKGRTLVASAKTDPGDLLMLLPALSFLQGELFQAPEPEDLQVAMLEDGLTAAQRRVLHLMDDPAGEQAASMTTLDVKFWSSRGNSDSAAPPVDAKQLLRIIMNSSCMDTQQDTAVMQIRQQAPMGFIGLWPEFALMPHSCVPNTALTVVGDRMLVHAADALQAGDALTRNCIGSLVTAPVAARQAAVLEAKGYRCNCPRCTTEEAASEGLRQMLQEAFSWYQEEAMPQWNSCQEKEDMEGLRALFLEAEQIVSEVEEAVEAETELSDDQRMWMRTAAYDCYDMLVMCDEFLNQDSSSLSHLRACLELIRIFAPGSESHTAVALKYDALTHTRAELAEYLAAKEQRSGSLERKKRMSLAKRGSGSVNSARMREARELRAAADQASELYVEAFFTRYGLISLKQLELLKEGLEMYNEGMEQMSVMKAEGKTEMSRDYIVDGIKFTLTDKLAGVSGDVEVEEQAYEQAEEGVKMMMMDGEDSGEVIDVEAEPKEVGVQGKQALAEGEDEEMLMSQQQRPARATVPKRRQKVRRPSSSAKQQGDGL